MRLVLRILLVTLVAVLPTILKGANALFVFYGGSTRAEVYDADSLQPLASIEVGPSASHAFGLADSADSRRFSKFYVVSAAMVSIFDGEFQLVGEILFEMPNSAVVAAASLAYDGRRLVVAAGRRLMVIDTTADRIIASREPAFIPSSIVATRDNHIIYVMSSQSRYVREFDLVTNEFSLPMFMACQARERHLPWRRRANGVCGRSRLGF